MNPSNNLLCLNPNIILYRTSYNLQVKREQSFYLLVRCVMSALVTLTQYCNLSQIKALYIV